MDFIAEIGANHERSLDRAKMLIGLAAKAGATVVKFQHFRAETLVSPEGFAKLGPMAHQKDWGDVYAKFKACETPLDWTPHLVETCQNEGVEFMTSPYDVDLVRELDPYVQRWKVGSGEITHRALLEAVAKTGKPVLLATGASEMWEVQRAFHVFHKGQCALMQCTTNYSGDPENVNHCNLNALKHLAWFGGRVGLSDHTRSLPVAVAAVGAGATILERHFTDDRTRTGSPDHPFAMQPEDWRAMVDACLEASRAMGDMTKRVYPNERETRIVQRRGLWDGKALRPCVEGHGLPW